MEFRVEEIYEKGDFRGLLRAVASRRRREKPGRRVVGTVIHIAAWVVMVFYVLSVVLLYATGDRDTAWSMTGAGILPVFVFALMLVLRSKGIMAALAWRNYKEKGQPISYRFCEDCFMAYTPASDQRFYYQVIEAVWEDQDAYYLFVSASTAHLLRKTAFTEGGAANFRDFIGCVTGKSVEDRKSVV